MRRIAVINQKGGVGKTTTAANLGAALAISGARVLLIDLDPQGHLSLHYGVELEDGAPSVYDVLTNGKTIADVAQVVRKNATLVAADIDLAGAEAELVTVMGREVLLREALESVKNDYDYMLIDCPPSLGVLTVNALVAVGEVLIPLQAHFLALQGLSKLLSTVTLVRQRINPELRVSGVVLCMHESTTRLAGEVVDDLTDFIEQSRGTAVPWSDARVFDTHIRRNIKLAESSSFGQTVFDYAPRSNGAVDYAKLASEMFGTGLAVEAPTPTVRPTKKPKVKSSSSATKSTKLPKRKKPPVISGEDSAEVVPETKAQAKPVSKPKPEAKPKSKPKPRPKPAKAPPRVEEIVERPADVILNVVSESTPVEPLPQAEHPANGAPSASPLPQASALPSSPSHHGTDVVATAG